MECLAFIGDSSMLRRPCNLVEHRQNGQLVGECELNIGDGLGLDPLRGIHHQ